MSVENADEYTDVLYDPAARLVVKEQKASASLLQRTLRIGWTRATALLAEMEGDGIVSAPEPNFGQRTVLVKADYFVHVDAELAKADAQTGQALGSAPPSSSLGAGPTNEDGVTRMDTTGLPTDSRTAPTDVFSLTRKSAIYVLSILTERDRRDHACARCVGQENTVDWPGVVGFVCVKHQLSDWLEGR